MKRRILFVIAILGIQLVSAQSKSESVLKWGTGSKEIKKLTLDSDSSSYYVFYFRNAKYPNIVDFQYVTIGDLDDLKTFTNTIDSLLTKVELKKGDVIQTSVGSVENITLSIFMGINSISIWDNSMLGYCYLGTNDVKKIKTIFKETK